MKRKYKYVHTTPEEEVDLIKKYLDGDTSAFTPLYHKYKALFFYNAQKFFPDMDHEEIEDISLEFLGRISSKLDQYNPEIAQVNTWITNSIRYFLLEYQDRKSTKKAKLNISLQDLGTEGNGGTIIEYQIPDERTSEIDNISYRRLVKAMLSKLGPEDVKIFNEHFINGNNQVETAKILGLPENTIWYRVKKIREKLKEFNNE